MSKTLGYCMVSAAPVRAEAADQSEIVSQLLFGEVVSINSLEEPWMSITTYNDNYEGYIDHKHVRRLSDKEVKRWLDGLNYSKEKSRKLTTPWGIQEIYRGSCIPENESQFKIGQDKFEWLDVSETEFNSPLEFALDYINTPYLWGGKSPFGIDCSGITQVIYRFFGFNLPRDASEQVLHGTEIEFDEIEAGDLAYFDNSKGKITHVGILDGQGNIIHASGHVRMDKMDKNGIFREDFGTYTHNLVSIKRL